MSESNMLSEQTVENEALLPGDESNVPLEEFVYRARLQRERENKPEHGAGDMETAIPIFGFLSHISRKKKKEDDDSSSDKNNGKLPPGTSVEVEEVEVATRAVRNATWMSVFYLITTDMLGPTTAPYAVSQLGFVPGSLLYFFFGIAAAYSGYILFKMYLKLDSLVYPLKNFGDVVGRIYGRKFRYGVDFLQTLQLVCNVAVIILGNGQGLYQVVKKRVCFAAMVVIWAIAGMIVGQVRTLQKFGFLSNIAIWLNLFVCFATMGVVAHSGVNYDAAYSQNGIEKGPVITQAIVSGEGNNFTLQLEAAMNIVYAYGGAVMFVEFMAEMRRPMDFWKSMFLAQSVIFCIYLLYGLFVYAYQGQFTVNPANQGISPYNWQTALNIVNFVSSLISGCLFSNISIKVIYNTFFRRVFKFPDLNSKYGKLLWIPMVIFYWGLCYVIASAIPQFTTLTGLVGAVCILQFTYTFPPIMALGLDVQLNAMNADGPYDPLTKTTNRIDTWKHASRWIRGFKRKWYLNLFHASFFLASLATAILGIYSSALELKKAYGADSNLNGAFSCKGNI
jgi:hypothetical protein